MRRTGNRKRDLSVDDIRNIFDEPGFHMDFINKRFSKSNLGSGELITSEFNDLWSFTQAGTEGSYVGEGGIVILNPAANTPKYEYNPATLAPRGLFFEPAVTNLLLQSADFSTTWTVANATVTTDTTTDPANTSTADTLTEDGTAGVVHTVIQNVNFTTGRQTNFSVWAKANGRNFIYLELPATAYTTVQRVWFNLSTGAVGTTSGALVRATHIQAFPNGWYRCMIGVGNTSATAAGDIVIGLASADNTTTYNGDGTSGVYLWGAQFTLDASSGFYYNNYIPTTTGTVANSAVVNVRSFTSFDFSQTRGTYLIEYELPFITFGPSSNSAFNNNTRGISTGLSSIVDFASSNVSSQVPNTPFTIRRVAYSYGPGGMSAAAGDNVSNVAIIVDDYTGGGNGTGEFGHQLYSAPPLNIAVYGGSLGTSSPAISSWIRQAHFITGKTYSMSKLMAWVHGARGLGV